MRPVGALPNRFRYHACALASAKNHGLCRRSLGARWYVRWIDSTASAGGSACRSEAGFAPARGSRKRALNSHRIRAQPDAVGLGGINGGLLQLQCGAAAAAPTLLLDASISGVLDRFPSRAAAAAATATALWARVATVNSSSETENSCTRPSGLRKDALATGLLEVRVCRRPTSVSEQGNARIREGGTNICCFFSSAIK